MKVIKCFIAHYVSTDLRRKTGTTIPFLLMQCKQYFSSCRPTHSASCIFTAVRPLAEPHSYHHYRRTEPIHYYYKNLPHTLCSSQVSGNVLSQYLHILFCLISSKAFLLCDWTPRAHISYSYMTVILITVLHTGRPSSKNFLQGF